MKAKPFIQNGKGDLTPCEPKEATHVILNMPGPIPNRLIPVVHGNVTRKGTCCWSWNGDTENPTLKPSIRTRGHEFGKDVVCHTFVNDGNVQFLSDCTHELAGKTMELLEVDW